MDDPISNSTDSVLRTRRRQLHVWLTDREYERLRNLADGDDVSVSAVVRHLLKDRLAGKVGPTICHICGRVRREWGHR